ncbi:MAG TPA: hypothetical protein VMG33_09045 [Steroidobacteraceae bacterium]|nr:hypothetical protein [Steroidobacteraceae bacterium]
MVIAMHRLLAGMLAVLTATGQASEPGGPTATVSHGPLVMRLSKDEFRIAFGINARPCSPDGCHGVIRYRVIWLADDGSAGTESKQVNYVILPNSSRTITVDRQYFDTAEGEHTVELTRVNVNQITCLPGYRGP